MKAPTWDQFIVAWRAVLGTGLLIYCVVVLARSESPWVPYVLFAGVSLLGLSISVPWERKKEEEHRKE